MDEDETVELQVNVSSSVSQSGRVWVEVPKAIYDDGRASIRNFLEAADFVDIQWDCCEEDEFSVDDWELA